MAASLSVEKIHLIAAAAAAAATALESSAVNLDDLPHDVLDALRAIRDVREECVAKLTLPHRRMLAAAEQYADDHLSFELGDVREWSIIYVG